MEPSRVGLLLHRPRQPGTARGAACAAGRRRATASKAEARSTSRNGSVSFAIAWTSARRHGVGLRGRGVLGHRPEGGGQVVEPSRVGLLLHRPRQPQRRAPACAGGASLATAPKAKAR